MICPLCKSKTKITNSREREGGTVVYRMRVCKNCRYAFRTYEKADKEKGA